MNPAESSGTAVRVDQVSLDYRLEGGLEVPVLRGLNLSIEAGEFVAIQGPSGSGKSTLLYIIAGLLRAKAGEVFVLGQSIGDLTPDQGSVFRNQNLGFVFQQFHLLPRASVLENILLPSEYPAETSQTTPQDIEKARALAETLGLGDRLDHRPNQLSGGQQQRVAIARALMREPRLLLADEPTGNLDSASSQQIMTIFRELNRKGLTVVLITHDPEIASQADRVISIRDGRATDSYPQQPAQASVARPPANPTVSRLQLFRRVLGPSLRTLTRHRTRSALTMLGIVIGIAAVLSMVTLGRFTKERILDSYQDLGVNSMIFRGYPNWDLRGDDPTILPFRGFDVEKDLRRLPEIFPDIQRLSPLLFAWSARASFGGRMVDREVRLAGINEHGLSILGRGIERGTGFSAIQVERRLQVCILGADLVKGLFAARDPIGELISVSSNEAGFSCRVIGTLTRKNTNDQWSNPNSIIYVPATLFQSAISNWWESQVQTVAVQVDLRSDIGRAGRGLEGFFRRKYGESGRFNVDGDAALLSQMNRFLTLFTVLLGSIAFVSLAVGGIGITNMMLVSVNERIKEIGLRKAIGATDRSIRAQLLMESVLLCLVAGLVGLILGFALYQAAIFAATQFVPKLEFAWVLDWSAIVISFLSIVVVGILSGLAPALRAERLQVIEALRSE